MSFARRFVVDASHDINARPMLIYRSGISYKDITQYTVVMQTNKKFQQ
jgi:hypothetical protein